MQTTLLRAGDIIAGRRRPFGSRPVRSRRNRARTPIPAPVRAVELGAVPSSQLQGARVEIRIGIVNTGRELSFETAATADEIRGKVAAALEQSTHLDFADVKGNSYLIPTANLAYVELGTEESRRVGFVA
jgi:predicted deacylase